MPQQQPQMPQQQQQLPQQPPPQNNYYIQQQAQQPPPQPIKRNRYPEYSFWDRMAMSRSDVFKLVLLSFVIVLGISIEKLGSHYITQYLADNVLSPLQEFIVRITYPVLIFLFLWIIKSL
jgi:ABC-type bacteriocin/lantibiotic exporter with double-glycine peptidase domain